MINRTLNIGAKIWIYDEHVICDYVTIESNILQENGYKYYKIHSDKHGWNRGVGLEHIFETKEEVLTYDANKKKAAQAKISSAINSVEDLLKCAYSHMFCEEYTDWNAITVVEQKAKELLGIDLKK